MPAVEVSDLTVNHGRVIAVDRLTFSADRGEVVALLGPNGAGKTSTVEVLEGYRQPTSGTVTVLGLDPSAEHRDLAPSIGVMLQSGGVYSGIRPLEILELFASFYADPADPTALLELVGLDHLRRSTWRQMSGGEQQRLSLALALVGRPLVAFLDEPSAGVDVRGRQLIRSVVRDLAHDGTCVLVTTHDLDEAEKSADRVVIIDKGRLVATGTPHELMSTAGGAQIRFSAPAGLDTAGLGQVLVAAVTETTPGEYLVETESSPATIAALTGWLAQHDLPLADLRAGRQRLEDVFLHLTSAAQDGHLEHNPAGRRRRSQPDRARRPRRGQQAGK
ncbi:MAG: ABC transporter ATP-binding protein [Acidimicrobiales bacterium]